jgi:hypothetical protein
MKKNLTLIITILILTFGIFTLMAAGVDYTEYKVQEGEDFFEVCEKVLLDCDSNWKQFLKFNGLNMPTDVTPGMILKIPNSLSKDRYAKVQFIDGDVEVYNSELDAFEKIRTNHVLVEGNILRTKSNGRAEVKLDDGTLLKLESDTVISLGEFSFNENSSSTLLDVFSGSVLMKITKLGEGDSFDVKTVSAVAGVRGTEFSVSVSGSEENAVIEISVLEGKVAAKATTDGDANELVLGASNKNLNEDTSANEIASKEGGSTQINKEETIGVEEGYTLQFNLKNNEAKVTQIPQTITEINIEEVDDSSDDDNDDDDNNND